MRWVNYSKRLEVFQVRSFHPPIDRSIVDGVEKLMKY